ncbi:hypothetical protein [Azospirillum tabaci]|uniref:hypothetical protein n=1 Tax=Azospirillum tabaci TaxID=2752310 RepID=UPI0016606722|nr:hypothetical protein [Azospirillum tabaci]
MMAKANNDPRMSINKLSEYIVAKAARQTRIIRDQKYPPPYITTYYRDAQEVISQFIANGLSDQSILEKRIAVLDQKVPANTYEQRRNSGNIEAIDKFINIVDDINLFGATPKLAPQQSQSLRIRNVDISVRPEVILTGKNTKGKPTIGGVKLHFPSSSSLTTDCAGYISAGLQEYFRWFHIDDGAVDHRISFVIDVGSGTIHEGAKSVKQRMKDIEAACEQIANLWPTITPPASE